MAELPGIYIHVPFCSRVCPYCDFAVRTGGPRARARYLAALLAEIAAVPEDFGPVETLYLGGGTPSALEPEQFAVIVEAVARRWPLAGNSWLSLEANPEDVTPERARAWRNLGFGTISLGVQSFAAEELRFLGRSHTPEQARAAVETAHEAGFPIVSIDLIFGLPGQGPRAWRGSLAAAVALRPQHLSCYQLTVHDGTPFGRHRDRGTLREIGEDRQAVLFRLAHEWLPAHGYEAYEVSNFATRPEHRSRHNSKYWRHAPYLGLGPSAHSFDGTRRRWWNLRDLGSWAAAIERGELPRAGHEDLAPEALALESLLLGLRTAAGVDLAAVATATGVDLWSPNQQRIEALEDQGLLRLDGRRLIPTPAGLAVAEWIARDLEIPASLVSESPAAPTPGTFRRTP